MNLPLCDDMVYEVRLLLLTGKGLKLMEHWFEDNIEDAATRRDRLKDQYAHISDRIKIKVQPHLLKL